MMIVYPENTAVARKVVKNGDSKLMKFSGTFSVMFPNWGIANANTAVMKAGRDPTCGVPCMCVNVDHNAHDKSYINFYRKLPV